MLVKIFLGRVLIRVRKENEGILFLFLSWAARTMLAESSEVPRGHFADSAVTLILTVDLRR